MGLSYDTGPPALAQPVGDGVLIYSWAGTMCGRDGDQWWRFVHVVGNPHKLEVRVRWADDGLLTPHGTIDDFELVGFRGPACDTAMEAFRAVPVDTDGDLVNDTTEFSWNTSGLVPEEICVRLRAADPAARGRLGFSVTRF